MNDSLQRRLAAACTAQTRLASPLGTLLLARTGRGLAGAWFEGQKAHPGALPAPRADDDALLLAAGHQLAEYFAGRRTDFDIALDLDQGTAFQRAVWQALRRIARGATTSYGALARELGVPAATRAVGAAIGRNPLSVVVPCHRVVGADGCLTGYAGGLARKQALLRLEGAVA